MFLFVFIIHRLTILFILSSRFMVYLLVECFSSKSFVFISSPFKLSFLLCKCFHRFRYVVDSKLDCFSCLLVKSLFLHWRQFIILFFRLISIKLVQTPISLNFNTSMDKMGLIRYLSDDVT